ncbi:Uncharacterised protein [Klebsiella pneumoniae]|nr:Uncharacterised protein [Klebsiella pneumoniae]
MERTLNQLTLVIQQPLPADNNSTIIAAMESRHVNIQSVLIASQRLRGNDPTGELAAQIRHQRIA